MVHDIRAFSDTTRWSSRDEEYLHKFTSLRRMNYFWNVDETSERVFRLVKKIGWKNSPPKADEFLFK